MAKFKGREASIENVRKFFSNTTNDTVAVPDVFQSFERSQKDEKQNRSWLSNLLTLMKSHNLVRPHYTTKKGPKTLVELELTLEGKRALGRVNGNSSVSGRVSDKENGQSGISIEDILEALPSLRKRFQGFDIEFKVTPKAEGK